MLVQQNGHKRPKEYVCYYVHDDMCRKMIHSISDQLSIIMLEAFMPLDMIFSEINRLRKMLQSVFVSEVSQGIKNAASYQLAKLEAFYEECKVNWGYQTTS